MAATDDVPTHPTSLRKKYMTRNFFRPRKPVRWLSPPQLAGTGVQVFLADRLGAYLDKREMQGAFSPESFESGGRDGIWFDYVADTGDGFNATYAIARQLALDTIKAGGESLPRGQVLIMGGDQVYPTPSPAAYDERLKGPYRAALPPVPEGSPEAEEDPAVPSGQPAPRLYALPGNHDWYDGLTAFFRVFAGPESAVGAWRTLQKRSYFALHLAEDWWLFAVDAQFGAHIDEPQLEYFHSIIRTEVGDNARIILCTPEPGWVQSKHKPGAYDAIDYFLRKVISPEGQQIWRRHNGHELRRQVVDRSADALWRLAPLFAI